MAKLDNIEMKLDIEFLQKPTAAEIIRFTELCCEHGDDKQRTQAVSIALRYFGTCTTTFAWVPAQRVPVNGTEFAPAP